jgi:hypothetical protein
MNFSERPKFNCLNGNIEGLDIGSKYFIHNAGSIGVGDPSNKADDHE